MKLSGKVFITGGAGTLGKAIIRRATQEEWDCDITVYSRDWVKHLAIKREYPKVTTILGDILDQNSLAMAIAGHDIVIHCAAMKHIVEGEYHPLQVIETNVNGSANVLQACVEHNIKHVVGISTDKSCSPANAYGASKMLMEKAFQQYASAYGHVQFHLVRYGNVLGSTGSFIHSWREQLAKGEPVWSTDPEMTRFWLTEDSAVELIIDALEYDSGDIVVPELRSARIGNIEKWILGKPADEYIGLRPGEKIHETLITTEEGIRTVYTGDLGFHYIVFPSTRSIENFDSGVTEFTSENADRLTKEEFLEMLGE